MTVIVSVIVMTHASHLHISILLLLVLTFQIIGGMRYDESCTDISSSCQLLPKLICAKTQTGRFRKLRPQTCRKTCGLCLPYSFEHGTNLVWAQSPPFKVFSQARLVGIQGDPQQWVVDKSPQVTYIGAPHYTWEFSALGLNWESQILYWSESTYKRIQGLRLNGSRETMTIVSGMSSEVYGMAVDWLAGNLYYTDALYNWIMMTSSMPGKEAYRIIVNDGLDNPHGIAVHPLINRLFWSDWGARPKIETSNLLGENRRILVDRDIVHPKGLTIDYENDLLYWVDSFKTTIETITLEGEGRTVLHTVEGSSFYGLALYDNLIFVTDRSREGVLRVFDRKQTLISLTLSNVPYDILMYDQTRQPGNSSDCDDLMCQQLCVQDSDSVYKCICGEGYVLDETDMTSCKLIQQFLHPSHIYAIGNSICQYPANIADMSLTNITLDSQCFLEGRQGYITLTFDARNNFLYYFGTKTKTISRIPLEVGGKGQVLAGGTGIVNGMSLDWVTGNLYWTDTTHGNIRMGGKDCSYQTVVLNRLGTPFGIAVHPGRGKIYWTDHGHPPDVGSTVGSSNMDGSGIKMIMDRGLGTPNHLFIDFQKDNLYWSDSRLHHIRMQDLDSGRISVVFEQPDVKFLGISFYQDFLLWTDTDDLNGIHVARLDKKEKIRGVIHPKNGVAADLITFDVKNQPMFDSPCAPNITKCSQLCAASSPTEAKCVCGAGYHLADDGFTCTTVPVLDNFLLVNDAFQRQIFQINLLNAVPGAVDLKLIHQPIALTYDPYDYKVFWSDNKAHIISEATIEGRHEKIVRRFNDKSMCNGLAADYINKLLFFTDAGNDVIGVVSMLKNELTLVLVDSDLDDPRDIVVAPHNGSIYWTDWGKSPRIEMAYMDGSGRTPLVSFDDLAWPNGLALDAHEQKLYWVDAHTDTISLIDLQTRRVQKLLTEEGSHYFSIAVIGDYLYINDWKRNYLVRMNKNGGRIRRYGDTVFTRLYGMEGFNSSEAFKGTSVCAMSACEHLCLPKDNQQYTCRCSQGYVLQGIACIPAPLTTTTATTIAHVTNTDTLNVRPSSMSSSSKPTLSFRPLPPISSTTMTAATTSSDDGPPTTSPPDIIITKRPFTATTSSGLESGSTTGRPVVDTTIRSIPSGTTTISLANESDIHARMSTMSGIHGLSTTTIVIIVTSFIIVVVFIVVVLIIMYLRNRQSFSPHKKLVESGLGSMQKIVYKGNGGEECVTFEGGIENPMYDCMHNNGPTGCPNPSTQ